MSSSTSSTFPPEVIDLVIESVSQFPDKRSRIRTLSSAALVSCYCRHRAHARLFSNIHIHSDMQAVLITRPLPVEIYVRKLRALIDADPQSETTGIASHVRSLTVNLSGTNIRVRRILDDGTLAAILRKIFRTNDVGHRSLSLSFLVRGSLRNVFDWESLNEDFLSTFHDLCRNPLLSTLHLAHFVNLPRTLLHHSFIKNVRFSRLQLAETGNEDEDIPEPMREFKDDEPDIGALEAGQAVPLESIETDHSLPLLDLIDMTPQQILHPRLAFSQLKKLTAHMGNEDDFHKTRWILLNAASTLRELDIILFSNDELPEPEWRIAVAELPVLKTISIIQNSTSYKTPGRTTIPQICALMDHIKLLPDIEEAKVSLFLYSQLYARTAFDIFDGHDFSPLDGLFSHGRFLGLKRLTIQLRFNLYLNGKETLDFERFRVESTEYVQKSFLEMSACAASGRLQFDIQITPDIVRHAIGRW